MSDSHAATAGTVPEALPVVVAVSGGSGAVYARRLLQVLCRSQRTVHLLLSAAGAQVIQQELGLRLDLNNPDLTRWLELEEPQRQRLQYHTIADYFTPDRKSGEN
jgi:3-polyprenyl-4-hydroxybenzoate decarboxylase